MQINADAKKLFLKHASKLTNPHMEDLKIILSSVNITITPCPTTDMNINPIQNYRSL